MPIPRRPLLLISAAVLSAHALVLGWASLPLAPSRAATPLVFHTRTLVPPPVALPPPAPAPSTRPAAAPAPKVRRSRPTAAPAPSDKPSTETAMPDSTEPASALEPPDTALLAPSASTPAAEPAHSDPAHTAPEAAAPKPPEELPPPGIAIVSPQTADADSPPTGSHSAPVRIPDPALLEFTVQGQAKHLQYNASAELLWQHDGQQYQARQEIKVLFLGSRAQTSVGSITPLGLQPRRFGDRSRSEKAAHFDFEQGLVTFSANTPSARIALGTQDRLSVFFQLSALLAAAPQGYPVGTQFRIPTVSARAADLWTFTLQGEETLELPLGSLRTLQLERLPRRDYDLKAQVWLAPALDHLPARIRITQANGDFVELNLRSHKAP